MWTIQLLFVPAVSPLLIGIIRKIKAKMQNRQGASIIQPYRDIWKLFHKDEIISEDASWVFRVSPYIIFTVTILVGASVPLFIFSFSGEIIGDFLAIIYLLALGTFFLALSGIDTGSAFGGFGSSREMMVVSLAEGGLIFAFLTLALSVGSTNLFTIVQSSPSLSWMALVPIGLAFLGFIIVLLAENGRFPFDNPATHLELTMIHEAMILEYSGKKLALMEWAAANKLLIFIALGANLFLPLGVSYSGSVPGIIVSLAVFLIKVLLFCIAIAVLESSIAKFRYFRLPDLLFTSFILSVIGIGLII